jgi:hypothetical protein
MPDQTEDHLNSRELLVLAAKAAGIEYWIVRYGPRSAIVERLHTTIKGETVQWNPIAEDEHAFRLAVMLGLSLHISPKYGDTAVAQYINRKSADARIESVSETIRNDPCAATRMAIVRAAAAIGRSLE